MVYTSLLYRRTLFGTTGSKAWRMIAEATKRCKGKHGCGRELPVSAFYRRGISGLQAYCKECCKAASSKWNTRCLYRKSCLTRSRKYGLTVQEVELLWQIPACQSCGSIFKSNFDQHFDHCHELGHVRGVICRACNTSLSGTSEVAMSRLQKCIEYLKRDIEREQARTH